MILKTVQGLSGWVRVIWIVLAALSLLALLTWHRRAEVRRTNQRVAELQRDPTAALEGDLLKRASVHAEEARRLSRQLERASALAKAEGAPKVAELIARWNS